MKRYRVGFCYTCYAWQEVEANSKDEAWDIAAQIVKTSCEDPELTDWERWTEADQVEEM
jgi:hypothetical protein